MPLALWLQCCLGCSIGVGITAGPGGTGLNVNASVQKGSGFEKGNSQYATDTTVNTGATLTLNRGNNTTLTGAQATGDTVIANVGGDLTLTSQQAIDTYDAQQKNVSAGGSVGLGNGSLSLSANRSKMESDYQSVQEQTGLFAGEGGFDITVGKHTQLDGAVMASQADAEKNRLDTGTLGFRDIHNHAEFKVEQHSAGFNSGSDIGGNLLTKVENNALGADAGTALGFWFGKNDECGVACKAEIAKGIAEGNLVVSAGVAGVAGGAMIVGATPEIVAAAKAALEGCKAAPTICLNNAGLQVAEAVTPGGVGAAGAIGVGKTVAEATMAKAEAVTANAAKNAGNTAIANVVKNTAETQASIDKKLTTYLLEKEHPAGGSKAEWFDSALGFNKTNSNELAKQIIFDPNIAVKTAETHIGSQLLQLEIQIWRYGVL